MLLTPMQMCLDSVSRQWLDNLTKESSGLNPHRNLSS
uniref:Uncharacterized protein n=1 Tax=Rhizophora mucronata TaxID=61149 RepID=A0A2P2NWZ8_RHIMU